MPRTKACFSGKAGNDDLHVWLKQTAAIVEPSFEVWSYNGSEDSGQHVWRILSNLNILLLWNAGISYHVTSLIYIIKWILIAELIAIYY